MPVKEYVPVPVQKEEQPIIVQMKEPMMPMKMDYGMQSMDMQSMDMQSMGYGMSDSYSGMDTKKSVTHVSSDKRKDESKDQKPKSTPKPNNKARRVIKARKNAENNN